MVDNRYSAECRRGCVCSGAGRDAGGGLEDGGGRQREHRALHPGLPRQGRVRVLAQGQDHEHLLRDVKYLTLCGTNRCLIFQFVQCSIK